MHEAPGRDFPSGASDKESKPMQEIQVQSLGWVDDPLE